MKSRSKALIIGLALILSGTLFTGCGKKSTPDGVWQITSSKDNQYNTNSDSSYLDIRDDGQFVSYVIIRSDTGSTELTCIYETGTWTLDGETLTLNFKSVYTYNPDTKEWSGGDIGEGYSAAGKVTVNGTAMSFTGKNSDGGSFDDTMTLIGNLPDIYDAEGLNQTMSK